MESNGRLCALSVCSFLFVDDSFDVLEFLASVRPEY